jgi:TonB family protein
MQEKQIPVLNQLGFGLSSAGGVGGPVQLDVANFCCPEYLAQLVSVIQRTWDQNQGVVGSTTVRFTIARDGTIQAAQVEMPSGFIALDNSALRAVQISRLAPLPAAFQNPTLTVHMRFDYQR